jgi:hypothetical protein
MTEQVHVTIRASVTLVPCSAPKQQAMAGVSNFEQN